MRLNPSDRQELQPLNGISAEVARYRVSPVYTLWAFQGHKGELLLYF